MWSLIDLTDLAYFDKTGKFPGKIPFFLQEISWYLISCFLFSCQELCHSSHSPHWLLARGDEWASNHFEHIFSTVHAKADPRVWPLWDPSQRVRKRIIIGFCDRARVKKGLQRPQKICALCSWSIMRTNGFIMIFRLKKHFLWFNFGERIIYWLVRGT